MKKRILIIIGLVLFFASGCMMQNTPTNKVEALLNKYNKNDEAIVSELDDYIERNNLSKEAEEKYKKIYLKQFSDLKYEIKNETIDGDRAIVTVQITVYDFYKTEMNSNNYLMEHRDEFSLEDGGYDKSLFELFKLDNLDKTDERVDYTIDFTLTKVDNEWQIDNLTDEQLQKIHGVYAYE